MNKFGKFFRLVIKAMKWCFIAFCIFLASLWFRRQKMPTWMVDGICGRLSAGDYVFSCGGASFGFRGGLRLEALRVYDRSRRDPLTPLFSAERISVIPWARRVKIVAARFPRLGDSYYYGGSKPDSAQGLSSFRLPRIRRFSLELIRSDILGVVTERVASEVSVAPQRLSVRNIRLEWPDQDDRMWLDGFCEVDLAAGSVSGEVRGTAKQSHIRPLLKALDLPSSYHYMGGYPDTGDDGFTGVIGPVPASCAWKADLTSGEFTVDIDLHPEMGSYNAVRLKHVDGGLSVHCYFRDDWMGYDIRVGPLTACDHDGRRLQGELTVHGTNGLDHLEFDAASTLEKQDILDIMGYLNRGTLDCLECETAPTVSAKGIFNCDDVNIANNRLDGSFDCEKTKFFGQSLSSSHFDYRIRGDTIVFTNVTAKGETGGDIRGWSRFHLPIADGDEDFSGCGHLSITNGRLARIPLFSVLTEALADNVPGIDVLVNQSEAGCDFTISNGVFRTENLVVEGALFCIKISGTCDLTDNRINFIAHCTVFKKESFLGKYLIQPILWPFTKLLTEFEVTGTASEPKLRNTSVKKISDGAGKLKSETGKILKKAL